MKSDRSRTIRRSIANGIKVSAIGTGTLPVILKNKTPIRIENVLHVSDLDRRLLSIPALAEKGLMSLLEEEYVTKKRKFYVMECAINELALVSTSDTERHDQQLSVLMYDMPDWNISLPRKLEV